MHEWKYQILHLTEPISENHLKRMGKEGWEMAGCATQELRKRTKPIVGQGSMPYAITKYLYYFKMPRERQLH